MPEVTRRRSPDAPEECWHVYYDDVRAGTIANRSGIAAIGLRTIICVIIQERAKIADANGKLATRQDLALDPMISEAIATGTFPQGETKLLQGFQSRGQKVMFDNVVHKPGDNMLINKDDLSAAVDLLNKLLPTIL